MDNSINVSVRVRPLTARESSLLQTESTCNSIFQTGASLAAASSSQTASASSLNQYRSGAGLRRVIQVVECVFIPVASL